MSIFADFTSRWFDLNRLLEETFVQEIEFHRECVSTNDLALSREVNRKSPALVVTDAQTGGRGRGSNQWWAREGALTFSLRISPSDFGIEHERWPLVSLTTAIAVADTLGQIVPEHEIGLKWPNDVFLNRRKVSGILVEPPRGSLTEVVIGVGINVANSMADAPEDIRSLATSLLDETQNEVGPCEVLRRFLVRLELLLLQVGSFQLPLQDRWRQQCILTGRMISLEAGSRRVTGVCHGIGNEGAILVETDGEVRPWFGGVVRPLD